jgi:hypothetical protein
VNVRLSMHWFIHTLFDTKENENLYAIEFSEEEAF